MYLNHEKGDKMLKKLFNDKKFIFIFSFLVELILYYFFEYLYMGGIYIVPDIGIAPIFGLMFGPVGDRKSVV